MDNEKLISKIFFEIQKDPSDYRAYEDVFSLCRSIEESDFKLAHDTNAELRSYISRGMKTSAYAKLFDLYRRSLLFDAPYKFDSYLLYIEINRKPEERFYQPRRRILKQVVDNLQKLVDDELDELFISMPPRVGKTTILMFFVTWLIGRNSESSNLYSAYSDTITKAFYNGVLETIQDPVTYLWKDVFKDIGMFLAPMGMQLNQKTQIFPLKNGIDFLGFHIYLTETGKTVWKIRRRSKSNMSRKLKKFRKLLDRGLITMESIHQSYQSWKGHALRGNCHHLVREMDELYNSLFKEDNKDVSITVESADRGESQVR